jgi:hypothetical protein
LGFQDGGLSVGFPRKFKFTLWGKCAQSTESRIPTEKTQTLTSGFLLDSNQIKLVSKRCLVTHILIQNVTLIFEGVQKDSDLNRLLDLDSLNSFAVAWW